MSAPIAAIAFDLDGTLIDTAPDIDAALNAALTEAGLQPVPLERTRGWIGDGPEVLIQRALAHLGVDATAPLRARLLETFEHTTLTTPMGEGVVFDGIEALLAHWHGKRPMVCVTNKPGTLSRSVLEAAGLMRYLDAVHGADTPALRKPAPGMLQNAAAQLGISTAQLLMVGDSVNDLRCAHAAGCPSVWVAWGYGAYLPPEGAVVPRIDTPRQLADIVSAA